MSPITCPTISQTFLDRVKATPNKVGFQYKPTYSELGPIDQWKEVTFKEFYNEARIVSFGLMGLGVKPGDRVVILSNTRFEWSLCDMAILGASATTIPIYASNIAEDVVYIAEHADARILILEDAKQLQKILEKRAENPSCLPQVEKIVVIEPSAMNLAARYLEGTKNVLTLQALKELGSGAIR
jgi:long-chain acyl-CoA synthetase